MNETVYQNPGEVNQSSLADGVAVQSPTQAQAVPHHITPFSLAWFKKWGSLIVLSLALAIIIIDSTLLNVSLATIIRELHTNIQSLQWVISAYSLTLAALTITGGRLGDLFGRKKMFMTGAVIFAIGSFIASISNSVGILLAGESIIEGIGAALMMPATASLLVSNFHGKERAMAFGVWGGIAAASSAIGPILGGYLTNTFSWRWGFRINIFVVAILLLGSILIKEARDTREKPTIDWVGILLSATGLFTIVYALIESSDYGWLMAKQDVVFGNYAFSIFGLSFVPLLLIAGLFLLDLFFEWELRMDRIGKTPLVSMKIFKNHTFTAGSVTTAVLSLGQIGLIFILPVFLQAVLKLDALHTGLAMLPMSAAMLVVAPLSGFLASKIAPKWLIQIGLLINVTAIVLLRQEIAVSATTASLVPGLLLYGIGMGLVMAQISNLTLSAVPVYQAGEASGVNNTLRQVGATLGSSIIGAILLLSLSTNLTTHILKSSVIPINEKDVMVHAITTQTSNVEFGGGAQLSTKLPPSIVNEVSQISKAATVEAVKTAALYASIFAFLGFLLSFTLPKPKKMAPQSATSVGH